MKLSARLKGLYYSRREVDKMKKGKNGKDRFVEIMVGHDQKERGECIHTEGCGEANKFSRSIKTLQKMKKIFRGGFQGPRDLETKQTPQWNRRLSATRVT